ncbi:2-methylcitrate dehydratase [Paraphaeosphaeria sporulosa]
MEYDRVIADIARYVYGKDVKNKASFEHARLALLDAVGCAIEAISKSLECRRILKPWSEETTVPNGFRLPGTEYRLDPVMGAFSFGTQIRYLDHNDALGGKDWGHPSDNLGAILAVADWLNRCERSGARVHNGPPLTIGTVFEALIKAYEIQGLFLMDNAFNAQGLDHVILVKLASTAVVSWLIGLTEQEAMGAISQVFMDNSPLRVYRSAPNTISRKGWAGGDACMRAVQFALLTKRGQQGAPTALTARKWGFYDTMWKGGEFSLPRPYGELVVGITFYKVIACEGHGISAVEAALKLHAIFKARGIDVVDKLKRLRIRTTASAALIINKTGPLVNAADRDHCIQYMVAVTLLKGSIVEPYDYQDASPWASDARVDLLRQRMEIHEDVGLTRDYNDLEKRSVANGLSALLLDSTALEEILVEYPTGHRHNPATLAAVEQKFWRNMSGIFAESEIKAVLAAVRRTETPVMEFVDMLARPNGVGARL